MIPRSVLGLSCEHTSTLNLGLICQSIRCTGCSTSAVFVARFVSDLDGAMMLLKVEQEATNYSLTISWLQDTYIKLYWKVYYNWKMIQNKKVTYSIEQILPDLYAILLNSISKN